jgi:uncharacterized protein (UPF0216 family)
MAWRARRRTLAELVQGDSPGIKSSGGKKRLTLAEFDVLLREFSGTNADRTFRLPAVFNQHNEKFALGFYAV